MQLNRAAVREQRTLKGWTQQQLADVTGLSLRTIQRVEVHGNASMETISALCATLEVEREALFPTEEPATPATRYYWVAVFVLGTVTGAVLTLLLT